MYPQVFGKYVLERELARGGMARVVLATLRGAGGFEKKLVVKQIRDELACDDEFVRRFVDEAKTTVALSHPNIVPVYELGVELGTYFLAMEYVDGASVADLLRAATREGKTLSPEEGAYVGVEVCRALDYAHRRMHVVHRDVTPRNVMSDQEGQVKVIDFGISSPVLTAPSGAGVFGSPGHMPPEQMEGRELTPAADVFAVAVLLVELWTGKAPFRRRTTEEITRAMRAPHPKPSAADPRLLPLDDVIAAAMSLDPAARPQNAEDLSRALRKFLGGVDVGDVARQLGARVRKLHEDPPPPATDVKQLLQRPPSRGTGVEVGTKTFAARSDVMKPVDGVAATPGGARSIPEAGTRRVASSAPPPPDGASPASAGARSRPGGEIETVATKPIETDPRPAPAPRRGGLAAAGVGAAALVAVVAYLVGKGAAGGPPALGTASTEEARTTTTAPSTAPSTPASATGAAASTGATAPPATTSAAPAVEKAQITLVGDGATVAVDGVSRGACPVRVSVEPGAHTVVFTYAATGERLSRPLRAEAGDRVTVRADFTGVKPTVQIQR
jgi:serine/threonine protein kinase